MLLLCSCCMFVCKRAHRSLLHRANLPRASHRGMHNQQRHRPRMATYPAGGGGGGGRRVARQTPVSALHRIQRPSNNKNSKSFFWTIMFLAVLCAASTSHAFCVPRVASVGAAPSGRRASPLARSLVDKVCKSRRWVLKVYDSAQHQKNRVSVCVEGSILQLFVCRRAEQKFKNGHVENSGKYK